MKYVVSDIHGCYDEFRELLYIIDFQYRDELYIIGDVIDRGPYPIKTLLYIMEHDNMHLIMGNHEKMMIEALTNNNNFSDENEWSHLDRWRYNGGGITEAQFRLLKKEKKQEIIKFLAELPLALEVEANSRHYILIHGGPTKNFNVEWENGIISEDILWKRFETCSAKDVICPGKIIVVGHTPTSLYGYDGEIITIGDKRLIDCGCVFGDALGCLCLDTEEKFYVQNME